MTDLELTKRCAERMGIKPVISPLRGTVMRVWFMDKSKANPVQRMYDPLHDDAQAFALVKQFNLEVICNGNSSGNEHWHVHPMHNICAGISADLNRAIVECVANLPD